MRGIINFFRLIRLLNCLLAAIGVIVGARMTWLTPDHSNAILAALVAFLVCAAGNVLNDLLDIDVDRVNRPKRALASGGMTTKAAFWITILLNAAAIAISAFLNWQLLTAVALSIVLLVGYNFRLKKIPILGNLVVALLAGLTFIVGGLSVSTGLTWTLPGPLVPATFAFFFHVPREVVKDVEDMDGDVSMGRRSLPLLIGPSKAIGIAWAVFAILIILLLYPIVRDWYGRMYEVIAIYVIGLPTLGLLALVWGYPTPKLLSFTSTTLKIGMFLGVILFLNL